MRPPTLVLTDTMVSTGHLPKFEDEAYHLERDDLWAIPTAEVPLTSMWRGDILDEADLPLRLTAATACFRREAGAAGRDTRGLLRVHEFDKVELFAYATPEQAAGLLSRDGGPGRGDCCATSASQYRVLDLCAGDLGNSAARTFDLEVYAPGVDQWLEVSSVSWCTDYQARRANIRYRPEGGGRPGARPHPQRLGPGLGADLGRPRRDRPSGRRLGGAARGARALPAGRGHPERGVSRRRQLRSLVGRSAGRQLRSNR